MKPAPFDYHRPLALAEAVSLLARLDDAKLLAGGQSLIPMMNFRLARPRHLVDLGRVPGLDIITEADGHLVLGAMARQAAVEASDAVRRRCPLVPAALRHVGHYAIRTRGTVGGSLAHADPAAELPCVVAALDAELTAVGPAGRRTLSPERFFVAPLTTALGPDEIVAEVRLPALRAHAGWSFVEFSRRHGDFAIVCAAAVMEVDARDRCAAVALALGGVAPVPARARKAEALLRGQGVTEAAIEAAAATVVDEIAPDNDIHASADYRAALAQTYAAMALTEAWQRARRGG